MIPIKVTADKPDQIALLQGFSVHCSAQKLPGLWCCLPYTEGKNIDFRIRSYKDIDFYGRAKLLAAF